MEPPSEYVPLIDAIEITSRLAENAVNGGMNIMSRVLLYLADRGSSGGFRHCGPLFNAEGFRARADGSRGRVSYRARRERWGSTVGEFPTAGRWGSF